MEKNKNLLKYEVRKNGEVVCKSSIPNCGYSPEVVKRMKSAGFVFYADGKRIGGKGKVVQ